MAAVVAGLLASPLIAHGAALSLTSQHLTGLSTCNLIAYPLSSAVAADTYVDQGSPTANNSTSSTLSVQSRSGQNQRIYIRFDLTKCIVAPPSTAVVRAAWLLLSVSSLPSGCHTYDVFATSSSWTASTLTWNNQPNPPGTTSNTPPSAQRTASLAIGSGSGCANHTSGQYVAWPVTADVAAYIAGTSTNRGWFIRDDAEDSSPKTVTTTFAASHANSPTAAPYLAISYTLQ